MTDVGLLTITLMIVVQGMFRWIRLRVSRLSLSVEMVERERRRRGEFVDHWLFARWLFYAFPFFIRLFCSNVSALYDFKMARNMTVLIPTRI